jgi:hypothetical protein
LAQSADGSAHRRLTEMKAPTGRHDTSLFKDRIKSDQQIEIQAFEPHLANIHSINITDQYNRFFKSPKPR